MVRVEWGRDPLLLFSDERRIGLEDFGKFQNSKGMKLDLSQNIMCKWGFRRVTRF